MLASLTTKLALKKVGLSSDTFNFTSPAAKEPKRTKSAPPGSVPGLDDMNDDSSSNWPSWMSVKALSLTVQPWLSPPPPPIPVAECPRVGDLAPIDRDRKLTVGGGKPVLVVFLRCVGCAFAQKTFLALRNLATKHASSLTCIAVSHSSAQATQKWLDILGGAWAVQIVIDEDRAVYAAWGLGLGSVWYVLNPTSQVEGWKLKEGWLGQKVAGAIQRNPRVGGPPAATGRGAPSYQTGGSGVIDAEGPTTVMGNKWQTAGAWAVNGKGVVIWGGKAARADDLLDLEAGCRALGLA